MNAPLNYLPAYLGLFAALILALVCNTFLDIEYGSFGFEVSFWSIVFGWTLLLGWRQRGEPEGSGKQKQTIVLLIAFVLTLLVFIPKWGFPRAGIYMLAMLQAAQNSVLTTRRQLHLGLLVSAVMVIFAAAHFRADWTMLFYLIPYVIAVVFTLVSEQISRHALNVRASSLGRTGHAGQGVAIAAATSIILALGAVLYLATPQVTWPSLAWRYGQLTNMGFVGDSEKDERPGQAGDSGAGQGASGSGENSEHGADGWPSPEQMREAVKRPGMPEWQSGAIMQMADLDEAIGEALAPIGQALENFWNELKEWLKEHRSAVIASLFALILLMLLSGAVFLLREARAGTWLRTRFDYWHLVRLRRYSAGRAGAAQLYRAMERLFLTRNLPRPVTANVREFLRETTLFGEDVRLEAADLATLFERYRYGPMPPDQSNLEQMRVLYRGLFDRLG